MTPKQFRSSREWQRARKRVLATTKTCFKCGCETTLAFGPRHRRAPSVDHVQPLALIDLTTAEGRRMACDPANLRVMCVGCNSSRGAKLGNRRRTRRGPQVWDLYEIAERKRQQGRAQASQRW